MHRFARTLTFLLPLAFLLAPAPADAQHFGRNKIQYRSFDFQVIRTDHFDVYFYEEERAAALDAARMAERAYARLSKLLNHQFRERKPIILYASHSDFQQTNATTALLDEGTGGFAEPIKSRLVLPLTGSYADFDHVLTHELVHAFQHDILYRRGLVEDSKPFGVRPPLWFLEGMAEYLSLGRVDAHTASWLRDGAITGYLRSIGEMGRRDDYLSYRFGQSLWAYIGAKWGDEAIGVLLQKAPRLGLARAFESTLGIPLDALSSEWLAAVRAEHIPRLAETQKPHEIARRLTAHERVEDPWFLAPALSPDGRSIAFLSQRDGFFFDLFLADARSGEVRRKLVDGAEESFESLRYMNSSSSFSPDGRFLAFSAQTGGRDALHIYDVQRGRMHRRLRFDLNGVSNPSWSPDGARIVFTGLEGGVSDLYVTTLDGALQRLTSDPHADLLPSWSPDGRTIAFSTDRGPEADFERLRYGNLRVALLHLADLRIELLPHQDEGKNLNPVWSPEGASLVWISDRTGVNDLYRFDLATRELTALTRFLGGAIAITPTSPALSWSRTGELAFVYFEDAGYNLYVIPDPRALPERTPRASRYLAESSGEKRRAPAAAALESSAAEASEGRDATGVAAAGSVPLFRADTAAHPTSANSFYRSDKGFRASARLPSAAGEGPLSVAALMDSPDAALPDAASFEIRDYDVKFTADYIGRPTIGAQVGGRYGSGVYGGSFVALSDMLGNHNLVIAGQVSGSFSDASALLGYAFLKRRANFGVSVEQVPFYRYLGAYDVSDETGEGVAADVYLRDVIRTAQVAVSYPFSVYRRVELGASATHFQRDALYRGIDLRSGEGFREDTRVDALWFVEPSAALVFDNALFGWTGPVFGRRYRVQLSRTFGSFEYTELLGDVRAYRNFRQRVVFAGRVIAQSRLGPDADRFSYFWGSPYYIRGYDARSFDLQGAECARSRSESGGSLSHCPVRDQLIGSSAAFANAEVRVPVITELQLGPLGSFPPVDAVAFFDAGLAWDGTVCGGVDFARLSRCPAGTEMDVDVLPNRPAGQDPYLVRAPLYSYGLGLRINVFYAILRLDYAFPLSRPDRAGRFSLSLGPSF